MKTFTSMSALEKLDPNDPAYPVDKQLLEWLINDDDFPDFPYDPDDHGYVALVEQGDEDRKLSTLLRHSAFCFHRRWASSFT